MPSIGIVIHANALLFSNGITQNAYFLYKCLTHIGYSCRFLCNEPNPAPFSFENIPLQQIVCNNELIFNPSDFSLILSVTRAVTSEQYKMFHAKGIRVIGIICGNHFMQDQEDFIHGREGVFYGGKTNDYDEFWTIPCYEKFNTYLHVLRKVPVYSIPHLWDGSILKKRAFELSKLTEDRLMYDITKHSSSKIDIIIMEPNLALFKNAWLPIIAAEYVHMKNPELINDVFVFNYPQHSYCYSMIQTLSLGKKVRPFCRLEMDQILDYFGKSPNIPIFVSFQTNNSLNYLYYELLYYGYPLVHNSDDLDGCGYYYKDTDLDMCVESILHAYKHHHKTHLKYKIDADAYLKRVDPLNTDVCRIWNDKIKSVLT